MVDVAVWQEEDVVDSSCAASWLLRFSFYELLFPSFVYAIVFSSL